MSAAAAVQTEFAQATVTPVALPDHSRELWMGIPKAGKTLGGDDKAFFQAAGFGIEDKRPRVDDYRLVDGPEFGATGVRAFEMKPQMALGLIATGRLDAAIVGRDVLKEFNAAARGRKGYQQCVEVLDLNMAPCTLTLAVKGDDTAQSVEDLNGRVVVTKYREAVENWARGKGVQFAEIVSEVMPGMPIPGGIEGFALFDPRITVIADMVESGESLVQYNYKPLGITDADWEPIRQDVLNNVPRDQRRRYTDLPLDTVEALPGTVFTSRPVMVCGSKRLDAGKENALRLVAQNLFTGATKLGNEPAYKSRRLEEPKRKVNSLRAETPGFVGHGWRFNG